ncbi:MAG: MarR family transcriptional regulator [Proteobacteria bacterium]|nr:MarR family transcriptional regulator [Pseudomonadota bacterium]
MAQTPSPGAGSVLDDLLLYRLSRLLSVGGSPVIRLCEGRFGITRREWRVLATLVEHGGKGLGSSQLAELAQLDRARTSRAVGSLVAKGLMSRSQPGGDRRQVILRLTDAGHAIHAELFPMVREINAQLMAALTPQAAQQFDESLARLQARAQALVSTVADLPKADRRRRTPSGA